MAPRTRARWATAAALAALLALIVALWLGGASLDADAPVAAGDYGPVEILRPTVGAPPDGGAPAYAVDFDDDGRILPLTVDAGPAEAPEPGFAPHVRFDMCDEPVEEPGPPPEGFAALARDGVVVAYDPRATPLRLATAILDEAVGALDEAARWVDAPRRETLLVVAYPSAEAMGEALGGPSWATGAYDGAIHVEAASHARSLRHEVLHAQLHATAPCVPYWLDEGLASRFERRAGRRAFEWLRMIHAHTWIPFGSLAEPLADDEGAERMTPPEVGMLYAQALAMAWMLEERGGEGAVARAVRASREGMPRPLLWDTAMPGVDGERLLDHLAAELFPEVPAAERADLRGAAYDCVTRPDGAPACTVRRR